MGMKQHLQRLMVRTPSVSRKNHALAIVLPIDPSLLYLLGDPVTQKLVRRTGFGNRKWSGRTNLRRPNLVRPD